MIEDVHEIIPGLFLGNAKAAYSEPLLKRLGITHVVNCAKELDQLPFAFIRYLHLPLQDSPDENIGQHFDHVNRHLDQTLRKGGKILVHCFAGISRSATFVSAYLIEKSRQSPDKVVEELRRIRPVVRPNPGFYLQLIGFYFRVRGIDIAFV